MSGLFHDLTDSLEQVSATVENAKTVVLHLQYLRANTSDDDWDKLMENEKLEALIDACTDLECVVEDEDAA